MILTYFSSYYYQTDQNVSTSSFTVMLGIAGFSEALSNCLISHLLRYSSPSNMILIFGSISSLALFLSSYIKSAQLFCWVYGASLGLQVASLFLPSLYILWNHYPNNKGFALGLISAFFHLGIIPFGYLFTMTTNPLDLGGFKPIPNSEEVLFDERVSSRVPWTIQVTSLSYLAAILTGLLLLPSKMLPSETEEEFVCLGYKDILTNLKFWNIFWMMTFSLSASQYILTVYKLVGLMSIDSDHFNSFIGMGTCIASAVSNVFYGYVLGKYNWKKIMIVNYLILIFLMATVWFTLKIKFIYALWVLLNGFFGGSIYTNFVLLSENDFPKDHRVLSCVCFSLVLVYFSPYVLESFVTPAVGYFYTFFIICVMFFVTIIQTIIHPKTEKNSLDEVLLINS